jgi:hypothetical protein
VTVALDLDPEKARPWIEAAAPSHPSIVDAEHVTDRLFGFSNVPMATWIDEDGMIVRPAETASIERSQLRDAPIPDGLPERLTRMFAEVRKIPDVADDYRAAIDDWVRNGAASPYALDADTVVDRSRPRPMEHGLAAANFELGCHHHRNGGNHAAAPWWREAHRLQPDNWTYTRQAWTLVTTADGEPSDLIQGPNDLYDGNWLDDVIANGGGEAYGVVPRF